MMDEQPWGPEFQKLIDEEQADREQTAREEAEKALALLEMVWLLVHHDKGKEGVVRDVVLNMRALVKGLKSEE